MARLLIERETIYQDEVDLIMEGKDVKEIIEYMDMRDKERAENPFKRAEEYANAKAKEAVKPANEQGSSAPADAPIAPADVPSMPTAGDNKDDKNE